MPSEHPAAKVRPAEEKWGCAFERCLEKARVVVTGPDGSEYGACATHTQAVKGIASGR
jgi:hypothetical protein